MKSESVDPVHRQGKEVTESETGVDLGLGHCARRSSEKDKRTDTPILSVSPDV